MKPHNSFPAKLRTMTSVLALTVGLGACVALPASGADTWKEEVLLHDGRKIIVERSQTYGGRREVGQVLPIKEHSIRFSSPGASGQITWTSEYGEELGRTNFKPIALHILNKTPYLVAVPNLCLAYNKWGRPNPPYVVFKHDGRDWMRIALDELPVEFQTINMVIGTLDEPAITSAKSTITVDLINTSNSDLRQPEYKTILREPMPKEKIEVMCEERVLYKGAWILPNDPAARKFIDSQKK